MTRIDRAAWARMKARLAEPRRVTVFKGRSIGQTVGVLENELQFADGNRLKFSGVTRGTIKSVFIDGRRFPVLTVSWVSDNDEVTNAI